MNKTDELLNNLKGKQPKLQDADAMAGRIMSKLPDKVTPVNDILVENHKESKKNGVLISIFRKSISVAAILVSLLFVYTQFTDINNSNKTAKITQSAYSKIAPCSTLKNVYTDYKEQKKISYLQIKRMIYEEK